MNRSPSRTGTRRTAKKVSSPRPASRARVSPPIPHPARIRILIADDQVLDRTGMVGLLHTQPDFEVVGESGTAEDTLSMVSMLHPSIVVLALHMPDADGMGLIRMIHAEHPKTHVLAVSERGEAHCLVLHPPAMRRVQALGLDGDCGPSTECLLMAVTQGALGAIRRDVQPHEFFQAVRAVASGTAWYEAGIAQRMQRPIMPGAPQKNHRLSEREMDVAALITAGRSNKEIATALNISEPTVKKHVGAILSKLGLLDRLQIGLHLARNPMILGQHVLERQAQ